MGLVIGMDEAGYGPNLGPLVLTLTAWEVPGDPREADLWDLLSEAVASVAPADGSRLHIADSKRVYSRARGLAGLERSVLSLLHLCGDPPGRFGELWRWLAPDGRPEKDREPWYKGDLELPLAAEAADLAAAGERLRSCCRARGVRLRAVRSDVVLTRRFNRLTRRYDSKGGALSRLSFELLRSVWDPDDGRPALVVADKHGGRNRYDELLCEAFDGRMFFRAEEGTARSVYRAGKTSVRFEAKAESHLPVAAASLVSKYLRQLAMTLFNRFWTAHLPALKPTEGYSTDARRFRDEVAAMQRRLGIADEVFWRER